MKWFLGLVLVVALIGGALYGVGRFLLPNNLAVTRTTEIARPRASVFAMTNDLTIVKEWSPYYARDPDADYTFSGEGPGPGQQMRWTSNVREVGSGRMSIVASQQNRAVDTILELDDRASLSAHMEMVAHNSANAHATSIAWTVSAECSQGWINVPCRYMNLILARMISKDLDSGLARLKTLAEQLPDVDFEDLNPEFVTVEPQAYVYAVASTQPTPEAVATAQALCLDTVDRFMTQFQLARAGDLVRVTTAYNQAQNRLEFRVGYPFAGPTPLTVATVQIGQTPSGAALHVIHVGPREEVRNTYAKIEAYLQAHRISKREDGLPWEIVHHETTGPDDTEPTRIEIFVPLQ